MNKSDYDKYYKKGGTYVIPVELFNELFDELQHKESIWKQLKIYVNGMWLDDKGSVRRLQEFIKVLEDSDK